MARYTRQETNMVLLTEKKVSPERFEPLYRNGMLLVEETAHYLDGDGRTERGSLGRDAASVYARESMRLTTRLMQLASWLLLQRAANSGEMTPQQMMAEKKKVKLDTPSGLPDDPGSGELPKRFLDLVRRSLDLQARVARIDAELYGDIAMSIGKSPERNAVNDQIDLLITAFSNE